MDEGKSVVEVGEALDCVCSTFPVLASSIDIKIAGLDNDPSNSQDGEAQVGHLRGRSFGCIE